MAVVLASACSKPTPYCRLRQSEARANLSALQEAQSAFRERHGHFANSFDELHFTPPDPNYYDVRIVTASNDAYLATATGKRVVDGDVWSIDERGTPVLKSDACR